MQKAPHDQIDAAIQLRNDIPPVVPPSASEIKRRRDVVERMTRLRERIGPVGIRADELLHESRVESER